jgi:hypothetical protein
VLCGGLGRGLGINCVGALGGDDGVGRVGPVLVGERQWRPLRCGPGQARRDDGLRARGPEVPPQLGVGLSAAVLLNATVVQGILLPSAMTASGTGGCPAPSAASGHFKTRRSAETGNGLRSGIEDAQRQASALISPPARPTTVGVRLAAPAQALRPPRPVETCATTVTPTDQVTRTDQTRIEAGSWRSLSPSTARQQAWSKCPEHHGADQTDTFVSYPPSAVPVAERRPDASEPRIRVRRTIEEYAAAVGVPLQQMIGSISNPLAVCAVRNRMEPIGPPSEAGRWLVTMNTARAAKRSRVSDPRIVVRHGLPDLQSRHTDCGGGR